MLDKLFETIETLKARIEKHKDYFHAGGRPEARTRAALIDPMLSALEWDVTDPDKVVIEPKTVGGWADYALLDSDREPVLFIEAKKLADRKPENRQVVGYTVSENIHRRTKIYYCAWTNGDGGHHLGRRDRYRTVRSEVPAPLVPQHARQLFCGAVRRLFET